MEKENAEAVISDIDFKELLQLAKKGHPDAMYKIIQFYNDDINKICEYITMPREDAIQSIITDFLEELKNTQE
jgi:hypothetical protein